MQEVLRFMWETCAEKQDAKTTKMAANMFAHDAGGWGAWQLEHASSLRVDESKARGGTYEVPSSPDDEAFEDLAARHGLPSFMRRGKGAA